MILPDDFIDRAQHVPYVEGGGSFSGADCWGIVELYYKHVLDVELLDRARFAPGCASVQAWYDTTSQWRVVTEPVAHCLVVLKAGPLPAGHVGVYFGGRVLHSTRRWGCVAPPYARRGLGSGATALLVRK